MLNNPMWVGLEAEGSYKGIMTLFVMDEKCALSMILDCPIPHIFFRTNYKNWDIIRSVIRDGTKIVSLHVFAEDLDDVPWDIKNRVHLLVQIRADWVSQLKLTDNIIIGEDYRGYSFVKGMAIVSKPEDYTGDCEYAPSE